MRAAGKAAAMAIDAPAYRELVLRRDGFRCCQCGVFCHRQDADVHHLIPRSLGGSDDPSNLITLCDGCHAAHHPNLQVKLSRRLLERWSLRLVRRLTGMGTSPRRRQTSQRPCAYSAWNDFAKGNCPSYWPHSQENPCCSLVRQVRASPCAFSCLRSCAQVLLA